MPTNSSTAFGQLRYIQESTFNSTPVAGNGSNLRMIDPKFKVAIPTQTSQEIRSDRMSTGLTQVDMNVDGGFDFELSGKEYDTFLEASLLSSFAHYGTLGIGTTFSATTTSSTITAAVAPTTTSAFTNLAVGSWIKIIPPAGATTAVKAYFADKWFKLHAVTAPTSTVITLDASTPIVAPGIVTAIAGYAISQSVMQNASAGKSFTFEYALSDVSQFLAYTGCRVDGFDLSLDVGSLIKGSFNIMGAGHTINAATTLPGSPVASNTLDVMNAVTDLGQVFEGSNNLLTNGSFVHSAKLSVKNGLRAQKAIGVFGTAGFGYGELAITGTLDVYFQDATYYSKWLANTSTSISLGLSDQYGNGYLFEMEKVQFKDGALNTSGRTNDVMLSLPFQAFVNPATGRGIRITRSVAA